MINSAAAQLRLRLSRAHGWMIQAARDSTDDEFAWSPRPTSPPIRFHLWHAARVGDIRRTELPLSHDGVGAEPIQIWHAERLVERWCLTPSLLGLNEQSTGMAGEDAANLRFGDRDALQRYAEDVFRAFEDAVSRIPDQQLDGALETVAFEISHVNRHLGSIEAIKGVCGVFGSATN